MHEPNDERTERGGIPMRDVPGEFGRSMKLLPPAIAKAWAEPDQRPFVLRCAAFVISLVVLCVVAVVPAGRAFEAGYRLGAQVTVGDMAHLMLPFVVHLVVLGLLLVAFAWLLVRIIVEASLRVSKSSRDALDPLN